MVVVAVAVVVVVLEVVFLNKSLQMPTDWAELSWSASLSNEILGKRAWRRRAPLFYNINKALNEI